MAAAGSTQITKAKSATKKRDADQAPAMTPTGRPVLAWPRQTHRN